MRPDTHILGDVCEAIAVKELTAQGYFVYTTSQGTGPIDIVALAPGGELLLLDVKSDSQRVNLGGKRPTRIYRKRSALQKRLGVMICYVNAETEMIFIQAPEQQART